MRSHRLKKILTVGGGAAALVLFAGGLFTFGYVSGSNPWQTAANELNTATRQAEPAPGDIEVYDLWTSVNRIRLQNKVPALMLDPALDTAASAKCKEMVVQKYWSHKDPKGADPWHFLTEAGAAHTYAAENIAKGFTRPSSIFNAWAKSKEDKTKMIDAHYTRVGYAVCKTAADFPGSKDARPILLIVQLLAG
jgi:hypothetical protein